MLTISSIIRGTAMNNDNKSSNKVINGGGGGAAGNQHINEDNHTLNFGCLPTSSFFNQILLPCLITN